MEPAVERAQSGARMPATSRMHHALAANGDAADGFRVQPQLLDQIQIVAH